MKRKVYAADIRPLLSRPLFDRVFESVGEIRQKKVCSIGSPEGRAASLAAGYLAEYALKQKGFGGCSIGYGPQGQPCVEGARICLSLSHSGDYAVCAVSEAPVGIDIQKIQPVHAGVLSHFFDGAGRRAFLQRLGAEWEETRAGNPLLPARNSGMLTGEAAALFIRLWTIKESYMKLTGQGMKMGFQRISVDLTTGLVWENGKSGHAARFRELKAPDGYSLTICAWQKNEKRALGTPTGRKGAFCFFPD